MGNFDYLRGFIGCSLNKDIFNEKGVLILPKETVLTEEHVTGLMNLNTALSEDDVVKSAETVTTETKIENAVIMVKDIFEEVRLTKKIPIMEIRNHVIPTIVETTEKCNIITLFNQLAAVDDYTFRHNIGVGVIATLLGKWLQLTGADLSLLTMAATLHDIGKMSIPQEIINKPDKLTKEEFAIMKKHTVYGYELLHNQVGLSPKVALAALEHHERIDGSGYPFGVKEEKIDYFSRIIAVADVFHAMTSRRSYHEATPFYEILKQMQDEAFGKLDPVIVYAFLQHMMYVMIGCEVILTDGSRGKIIMINPQDPTNPLIRIESKFIDLSHTHELNIEKIV